MKEDLQTGLQENRPATTENGAISLEEMPPIEIEPVKKRHFGFRRKKETIPDGGEKKHTGGKKRRWLILAAVALIAVGGLTYWHFHSGSTKSETTYTEEAVTRRTITQSLTGSGTLEPANSYTVTTLKEGDILSADFEEGDTVEDGTILYQIDSSDANTNIEKAQISLNQSQRNYNSAVEKAYVKATVSGSVYSLDVSVGDEVSQGQTIATIRNSSVMTLTVPFPADDVSSFYVGETATITLDGSFETLTGSIKTISGSNIVKTGNMIVRNVTVTVTNPGGLSDSQAATVSIGGVNCADSGTFSYQADSTITASSSGTVTAINAKEGSSVKKNQTIVTLGGDDLENSVQSAKESLENAELSLKNTQETLDDYTITSPIAGTIVDKEYKTGDKVESGDTLCQIYDMSYLQMTMSIDELDISKVSVGQTVQITADAVDGKTYEGEVTKISVAGTTTNGATSYPVTVKITDTDGLLPGMNVDAEIVISEADDVLSVSSASINRGDTVLITSDSPSASNAVKDQKAPDGYVYVKVETGVSDDDYIEITSGLQEGDTVAYLKASSSSGETTSSTGLFGGSTAGGGGQMPSGGGQMPSGGGPDGGPQG